MRIFFPITAVVGLVIFTATLKAQQPRMTTVKLVALALDHRNKILVVIEPSYRHVSE